MATIGQTTSPAFGVMHYGVNVQNECETGQYTMPAGGGLITNLHAYFNLFTGGPATCWLCLWDGSGNLLASVAVSASTGGTGIGGQGWITAALGTPVFVAGGTNVFFGFTVPRANGFYTSFINGGASAVGTQTGPPGAFSGGGLTGNGNIGAYADYTPGGVYVNTGSSGSPVWTPTTVYVNTGTPASPVWTPASGVYVNTGTPASPVWTPTG